MKKAKRNLFLEDLQTSERNTQETRLEIGTAVSAKKTEQNYKLSDMFTFYPYDGTEISN